MDSLDDFAVAVDHVHALAQLARFTLYGTKTHILRPETEGSPRGARTLCDAVPAGYSREHLAGARTAWIANLPWYHDGARCKRCLGVVANIRDYLERQREGA